MTSMISLTEAAITKINELIAQRDSRVLGIRIGVESSGCANHKYKFEYVYERCDADEEIEYQYFSVFVAPSAIMYIIGSQVDYVYDKINSGFKVTNPNEISRCGCGESFQV